MLPGVYYKTRKKSKADLFTLLFRKTNCGERGFCQVVVLSCRRHHINVVQAWISQTYAVMNVVFRAARRFRATFPACSPPGILLSRRTVSSHAPSDKQSNLSLFFVFVGCDARLASGEESWLNSPFF